MYNFFISHFSGDREIANIIANALSRITLNQINPWFSSDHGGSGGIPPGSVWLDSIREKLSSSKAVVVLLTPSSVDKPWIYFESGIGEARENCEIIPVCFGFEGFSDIPFPLAMYQCFLLSDYNSLKRFAHKLLSRYDIMFDEEMTKPFLENAIRELNKFSFGKLTPKLTLSDVSNESLINEIKNHFDLKLMGLANQFEAFFNPKKEEPSSYSSYSYKVNNELSKKVILLEIYQNESAFDVMNSIYFQLEDIVGPYEYLKTWILEEKSGARLDMLESLTILPAKDIFNAKYEWTIKKLFKHHNQLDSYKRLKNWG
jgi:TIR domain